LHQRARDSPGPRRLFGQEAVDDVDVLVFHGRGDRHGLHSSIVEKALRC
jgi:hypothetical protein